MVSLPDNLLVELDAEVKRRSASRRALLPLAAPRELNRRDHAELAAAIEGSEQRFRTAGRLDSADHVRSDRDPLVSAVRRLLAASLAELPTVTSRLNLD